MPTHLGLTTSIPNSPSPISSNAETFDGLITSVEGLADDLLWPSASAVDRGTTLPRGHFDALAALGLYGMVVGVDVGGLGLSAPQVRRVLRTLGSGCGVTAFAFAQHHGTTGAVASTRNGPLRDRWLGSLVEDRLAAIAYAHVRRSGPPTLVAEPDGADGWRFTGTAPWVTSWGLASVVGVAAKTVATEQSPARLVWALLPATEAPGLAVSTSFDLAVFGATQTVALNFDGMAIGPELVLSVAEFDRWSHRDRLLAARPNPLCLGIGDRALAELHTVAPEEAAGLDPWWAAVSDRADGQCLAVDDGTAELETVADARAETLLAVQRLTTALATAVGGRAMESHHPAQRLAREAMFYVIQAQNDDGKRAMMARLNPDSDGPSRSVE